MVKQFVITVFDNMNRVLEDKGNPMTKESLFWTILDKFPTDDPAQEFDFIIREEEMVSIVSANFELESKI